MFEVILVAVDGSQHGQHAAGVAGDLARAVNARELHVMAVYEPVPAYVMGPNLSIAIAARNEQVQQVLRQAQQAIGTIPGTLQPEMVEGSIADAVLHVAKERKCDLIVMGSRGFGRLEGALLGSNSQKVVSLASCPVLIVH